ncbi:MAG: hypothetical protein M1831_006235 [Alyxoria varia]|nr:MAG: hypothetical protein M1831_006235 [Alyxoria varia]
MPPPSKLSIRTSSVQRLLKEEDSYHKELEQQESRIQKLEKENLGENAEFQLNQERKALEQTQAVFPPLKKRLEDAVAQLHEQLAEAHGSGSATSDEILKANEALVSAKPVLST